MVATPTPAVDDGELGAKAVAGAAAVQAPSPPPAAAVTGDPLSIAYYCTGHGLGHATRSIEVCRHLVGAGHSVTVVTGAPARVFLRELPPARFVLRKAVLDSGAKQRDPFSVDVLGSLQEYHRAAVAHRDALLEAEAEWLRGNAFDLVVSDVVPLACAAAAAAGVPAVCVTNFSWDFIYSEYLTAQRRPEFRRLVWQIARDYACATLLLRLPGYVPMPAFGAVEDVPLVVRHARRPSSDVRAELGVAPGERLVVLIQGGHRSELRVRADYLPQGWRCVVCTGGCMDAGDDLPPSFSVAAADCYTPDLIAAADCVLGKIGYGTVSECLAHGTPLVFVRRDFFNEEPFLRKLLELHGAAVEMKRRDFLDGHWAPYLLHAATRAVRYTEPTNGAEVVAARLVEIARSCGASGGSGADGAAGPPPAGAGGGANPMARLRDAVVFGYLMAKARSGRVDVPDWYVNGADPNRRLGGSVARGLDGLPLAGGGGAAAAAAASAAGGLEYVLRDWELLGGELALLQQLPDSYAFLALLRDLADAAPPTPTAGAASGGGGGGSRPATPGSPAGSSSAGGGAGGGGSTGGGSSCPPSPLRAAPSFTMGGGTGGEELPEVRAARALFNWDDEVFVARAPGRLDVMGGVADYSGAAVLQMPIAEACHVALQVQPVAKQRLWRHIQARHAKLGGPPRAALRVVSYHADATNRAPTFDADLCDLFEADGVTPVPYGALRAYCRADPARSWGAYVAGCALVLAREHGVTFPDGLAVLVCSDVPEGKGVSSSAALEVAVMSALAAARGVRLGGRELALLCQRVENLVVGAPCGVMDQLASALGQAGQLLALLCQPAEVQGGVAIPPQVRFWGVDSGIRHSVGGADYGSVRVGAFMGLKVVTELARRHAHRAAAAAAAGGGTLSPTGSSSGFGAAAAIAGGGGGGRLARFSRASDSLALSSSAQQPPLPLPPHPPAPPAFGGHLANIHPSAFRELFEGELPESLTGAEFAAAYGEHLDSVTNVDPAARYAVRAPTAHPVHENFRVSCFRALLAAADALGDAAAAVAVAAVAGGAGAGGSQAAAAPAVDGDDDGSGGGDGAGGSEAATDSQPGSAPPPTQQQQEERDGDAGVAGGLSRLVLEGRGAADGPGAPGANGGAGEQPPPPPPSLQPPPQLQQQPPLPPALLTPLQVLGELMFQSHAAYSAVGLGSDGTNRLVELVREHADAARLAGRPPALYGAKITGGGSGGTVCVLGLAGPEGHAAVEAVAAQYRQETGYAPCVFAGSSPGAAAFGVLRLRRRARDGGGGGASGGGGWDANGGGGGGATGDGASGGGASGSGGSV